jgi:hypothetical protein
VVDCLSSKCKVLSSDPSTAKKGINIIYISLEKEILLREALLWPAPACPRNLTGSDRRLRKDKRQKTNMQKAGVRWAGGSDGDTQQPCPPPVSLLYTVATRRWSNSLGCGGHDIVVIRNRSNL